MYIYQKKRWVLIVWANTIWQNPPFRRNLETHTRQSLTGVWACSLPIQIYQICQNPSGDIHSWINHPNLFKSVLRLWCKSIKRVWLWMTPLSSLVLCKSSTECTEEHAHMSITEQKHKPPVSTENTLNSNLTLIHANTLHIQEQKFSPYSVLPSMSSVVTQL